VSLLAVLVALAAIGAGGTLLGAQSATFVPTRIPLAGRTSTVCTVWPAVAGSSTSVSTVVIRQAPGREGALTATPVGQSVPSVTLSEQGKGRVRAGRTTTELLQGVGVMATASSGEVFGTGTSGEQQGLMAAPCTAPGSEHWFVGVGAASSARSELILTNPDDAQAEVDLQFFGARGEVVVPGSPGILVDAHASRTVSLQSLVAVNGPLSVSVKATTGRVSAVARDVRSTNLDPAGADWHLSAVAPTDRLVIPDIPDGEGSRELTVTNPGTTRAQVRVQVLAQAGPFEPTGADSLEILPRSTATVDLAAGLVGQYGAIRLVSDQPVTGAVLSTSLRPGAAPDFAVQPASAALVRTGVVALATAAAGQPANGQGVDSELVLSNDSDLRTTVSYEVVGYDGVSQSSDDVLIGPGGTSTRHLDPASPTYLVVKVLDGSAVHGGVVYTQPEGRVAGLASVSLTSPDVASRAPNVVSDPTVGR
jgi:hypothetical protein